MASYGRCRPVACHRASSYGTHGTRRQRAIGVGSQHGRGRRVCVCMGVWGHPALRRNTWGGRALGLPDGPTDSCPLGSLCVLAPFPDSLHAVGAASLSGTAAAASSTVCALSAEASGTDAADSVAPSPPLGGSLFGGTVLLLLAMGPGGGGEGGE